MIQASLAGPLLASQAGRSFWFDEQASTFAGDVDWLFYAILWISVFFFFLIVGLASVFVVKYRRREEGEVGKGPAHNTRLEIVWTVIPIVLVVGIFWVGFKDFVNLRRAPKGAYEIQVTAGKWNWSFTYPNGYVSDVLHVPAGKPVKLTMTSEDVIHAFYVPAFRQKRDIFPGRYTTAWFETNKTGKWRLYCAEYCGSKHWSMVTDVVAHEPAEFETWLQEASNFLDKLPPAQAGERLFVQRGCTQCHSIDGKAGIGPTLAGFFGQERVFADGSRGIADEDYVRESILEPKAKVLAGYEAVMPTYQGRIRDKEITALIAYFKKMKQ